MIYRPSEAENIVLYFASCHVVITGISDLETAEQIFESFRDEVTEPVAVE